ncbi:MAG: hypothetical protein SFU25_07290 [Candidatus Caenarcaniphilales bacterium]|nr:hypothetical protein [Candidatus Caenarcaniphilales bacterium]
MYYRVFPLTSIAKPKVKPRWLSKLPFPYSRLQEYKNLALKYKKASLNSNEEEKLSLRESLYSLQNFLARKLAQMNYDDYIVHLSKKNIIPQELKIAALLDRKSGMLTELVNSSIRRHAPNRDGEMQVSFASASADISMRLARVFDPSKRTFLEHGDAFYLKPCTMIGKVKITKIIASSALNEHNQQSGIYTTDDTSRKRKTHKYTVSLDEPLNNSHNPQEEDPVFELADSNSVESMEILDWQRDVDLVKKTKEFLLSISTNPKQRAIIKLRFAGLESSEIVNQSIVDSILHLGEIELTEEEVKSLKGLQIKDITNIEKDIKYRLFGKGNKIGKTQHLQMLTEILLKWNLKSNLVFAAAKNKTSAQVPYLKLTS